MSIYQNYLDIDYENQYDIVTLIYCDFGVLKQTDREQLLLKDFANKTLHYSIDKQTWQYYNYDNKTCQRSSEMKREDILLKSQLENYDEGVVNAEKQGRAWGVIAMAVIFIFVTVFSIIFSRSNSAASYAASAMFWGFLSAHYIPQYRFSKKKSMLVISIGFAVASIASLLSYVAMVIK